MATCMSHNWPQMDEHHLEPVRVTGNCMLPCYHHGDLLLVSQAVSVRQGDRVLVKRNNGELIGGVFIARNRQSVTLTRGFRKSGEANVSLDDISFLGRIMWASQ